MAWEFGARSLEGLTRIAELIEHSVYEAGSLTRTAEGISFTLLNPPLRMGAFSEIRVLWDGSRLPPDDVSIVLVGGAAPIPSGAISPVRPLTVPVGQRTTVRMAMAPPAPGPHRVRLELRSVAIPPLVWFEFVDTPRGEGP